SDLAAAAHDPTRKRENHPRHSRHRAHRRLGSLERRVLALGEDEEIAAADAASLSEALLDEELALHHGQPPVAHAVYHLAPLESVGKGAERLADGNALGGIGETVEAGGGGARENCLPDALDHAR